MRTKSKTLFFAVLVLALALLPGCRLQKQATTTATADTVYITRTDARVDSVYVDRWRNIYTKGDTVYKVDSFVCYKWRDRVSLDTIYQSHTDSVYVDRVETVRRRSGYDRFVSFGFWALLTILLASVTWWIYKTFYRR